MLTPELRKLIEARLTYGLDVMVTDVAADENIEDRFSLEVIACAAALIADSLAGQAARSAESNERLRRMFPDLAPKS